MIYFLAPVLFTFYIQGVLNLNVKLPCQKVKRGELAEEWRKLHSEELDILYSSNIVRVVKSRRMRWASHVVRTRESRGAYEVLEVNHNI
jgi:hypothetical protein